MRVCLALLFLVGAVWSDTAPASRMTVFVSEDAPVQFSAKDVLSHPLFVISKSIKFPGQYQVALVPNGINGPDIKNDGRFKSIHEVLHSAGDKHALIADIRKLYSSRLFEAPLHAGDHIAIPSTLRVENYAENPYPVLFFTDIEDFKKYDLGKLKEIVKLQVNPDEIKPIQ